MSWFNCIGIGMCMYVHVCLNCELNSLDSSVNGCVKEEPKCIQSNLIIFNEYPVNPTIMQGFSVCLFANSSFSSHAIGVKLSNPP